MKRKRPFIIGLTGSIGTGKTTTADMFKEQGIPVWDADDTVRRLYEKDGAAVEIIKARFPQAIENGAISKEALRKEILNDPAVLNWLDEVVHPLVRQDREAFIDGADSEIILLDVPLLFETGTDKLADMTIVVTIDKAEQMRRVLDRGQMNEEQFKTILAKQMPSDEKEDRADVVIVANTLEDVRNQIAEILQNIKAGLT